MNRIDIIFAAAGFFVTVAGIIATLLWDPQGGVICVLILGVLLLSLVLLERRQMAKLQERVLGLMKTENDRKRKVPSQSLEAANWKRILGILQAQQVSMDILSKQIRDLSGAENRIEETQQIESDPGF